jgi:putative Mg2+ transporter-C (MgtC) family protein
MFDSDPMTPFTWGELLLRLGLASFLGLALGFDRELRGHDAGIRTHALVALSSAMIMISSLIVYQQLRTENFAPDPLRSIQGLSQAIGFIAAGLIFVRRGAVVNMTTAANIWIAAAVGMACGLGHYRVVAVGFGFALVLLTAVRAIERFLPGKHHGES